jgi:DNA polymerase-3 subunit epsilon
MSDRQLIVVDVETTSLDTASCAILEVAAINPATGETLRFVPKVESGQLADAEPEALAVNRYYERQLFRETLSLDETRTSYHRLAHLLRGNILGGSNPRFDAAVLERKIGNIWHHRLADLSAYAAGVLGLPLTELPGLEKVCAALDIVNSEPHSALGDADATARCFMALDDIAKGRNA